MTDLKTFCTLLFKECKENHFGFIDPWLFKEIADEENLSDLTEDAVAFKDILERVWQKIQK